jgi:hypothetical protein
MPNQSSPGKIEIDADPKAQFTLPSFSIVKGQTSRRHERLGRELHRVISHSKSGWVNQQAFSEYLTVLRRDLGRGPIALVMAETEELELAEEC